MQRRKDTALGNEETKIKLTSSANELHGLNSLPHSFVNGPHDEIAQHSEIQSSTINGIS